MRPRGCGGVRSWTAATSTGRSYPPEAIDDILQIVLRTLQSFILSPPTGDGTELRRMLTVWIGPVVAALPRRSRGS
ncbi:hypothetical protein [Mycobacterium tilburgii]|uniref:hypothetical protein n=1 Tax=Mycobacterium tilburgii TaxID=44467 RepID=UPI001183E18C|nr:hypothetical protein [Mycobacterium tilburgii]